VSHLPAEPKPHTQPHSSSQLPTPQRQAYLSNPRTARLFVHLTSSPNTCAAYLQGQDHSPSVTEYATSQSHSTCDLTASQAFSKCLDDDANHRVRPAVCLQFHDPRVKVRPASPFLYPHLKPSPALYLFTREVPPFHNGKHSHIQWSHSVEGSARISTPSNPRRTFSYVPISLSHRRSFTFA